MGDDFGGGIKRFMIDLIMLDPNGQLIIYKDRSYTKIDKIYFILITIK